MKNKLSASLRLAQENATLKNAASDADELIEKPISRPKKTSNHQTPVKLMTEHMTTLVA